MITETLSVSYNQLGDFYNIAYNQGDAQTIADCLNPNNPVGYTDVRYGLATGSEHTYRVRPFINGVLGVYRDVFPNPAALNESPYGISERFCALVYQTPGVFSCGLFALGELLDDVTGNPTGEFSVIQIGYTPAIYPSPATTEVIRLTEDMIRATGVAKDQYGTVLGLPYGSLGGRDAFLKHIGNKPHFLFWENDYKNLWLSVLQADGTTGWLKLNNQSQVNLPAWYQAGIAAHIGVVEEVDMSAATAIMLPDQGHTPYIGDIVVNGRGGMGVLTDFVAGSTSRFYCYPVEQDIYSPAYWRTTEELDIHVNGSTEIEDTGTEFALITAHNTANYPQIDDAVVDKYGTYGVITAFNASTNKYTIRTLVSPRITVPGFFSTTFNLNPVPYADVQIDDTAGASFVFRAGWGWSTTIKPKVSDLICDGNGRVGIVIGIAGAVYTVSTLILTGGGGTSLPPYPAPTPTNETYVLAVNFDATLQAYGQLYWERVEP